MDTPNLERKPTVPLKDLLQLVGRGSTEPDVVSTLASRLARLDRQMSHAQRASVGEAAGGTIVTALAGELAAAVGPDAQERRAMERFGVEEPSAEQVAAVASEAREAVLAPFLSPTVRERLLDV